MVQIISADLKRHEQDTGSSEYQVALLTERIKNLTKHFQINKKDFGSKRGLLVMIGRRRKLLGYLKRTDFDSYKNTIQKLGLRR